LSHGAAPCDMKEEMALSHVSEFAHVQCSSGGLILPAHSPYDRQVVRQHVQQLVGPIGSVQLGVDGNDWTVTRPNGQPHSCTECAQPQLLRCSRADGRTPICIACVLAAPNENASWEDQ
jgi:hypothetical protein